MRHVIVHSGVLLAAILAALAGCVYVVETPLGQCACEIEEETPGEEDRTHRWAFEYNAG